MKNRIPLFLFVLSCALPTPARIAVLPLQVAGQNHASLQWLGKAVSYYLTVAFDQNRIPVLSVEETEQLLAQNRIRFPFAMSKATALALARNAGATSLLWGRIEFNPGESGSMTVRCLAFDLGTGTQKELPGVTGNSGDLFALLERMLRDCPEFPAGPATALRPPRLDCTLPDFEKLIKSLLLSEADKRLELLLPVAMAAKASDLILWETAKSLVKRSEWLAADSLLQRMSGQEPFRPGRSFLQSLVAIGSGDRAGARARLAALQAEGAYGKEVDNNLAVLDLQEGRLAEAETQFRRALARGADAEIWANTVYLLGLRNQGREAFNQALLALNQYPDDPHLLQLFSRFLGEHPQSDLLIPLFSEFIPSLHPPDPEAGPDFVPALKNPFLPPAPAPDAAEARNLYVDARNEFFEGSGERALAALDAALEINPFDADFHHLLALIRLQQKQYRPAEAAAAAALLLSASEENYLLAIKVLADSGQRTRAREMLNAARQSFPESRALPAVKID